MSQASPDRVLAIFWAGLGRVPAMSRAGPDWVPTRSDGILAVVYQFENVTLKFEKLFTVLKRENYFTEIKEDFSVKLKMIFIDYYFMLEYTRKYNIFSVYFIFG
jgi:hypothetical protein